MRTCGCGGVVESRDESFWFRASERLYQGWGKVVVGWWTWRDEYRGGDLPHPPLYTQTSAIEGREEDTQKSRLSVVKGPVN